MEALIHIAEDVFYIDYINMLGCEIFEMIICVCLQVLVESKMVLNSLSKDSLEIPVFLLLTP